ncbi:MAG: ubiquinol oxidase subunit II [Proteobacteria bacterium]|nr:ubiquinol oxidase subunit II [Pseudomonadota bacterium]
MQKMPLLDPSGPIGMSERSLIITAFLIMLIPAIPVFIMTVWFAWHYRSTNKKATYAPKWGHSNKIEFVVWSVPAIIILVLGILTWVTTHELNPYKPIASTHKAIRIEAVALNWKWLFIYPDQHIATINQLVLPVNVPVSFRITSDTVMTSFFIPRLGSQIYAMAGMNTHLNLMASKPGTYEGMNSQFSGNGFAGMHFKVIATSRKKYDQWLTKVKNAPAKLDEATFTALEKPSSNTPVTYYSSVNPENMFTDVLDKYRQGMKMANSSNVAGGSTMASSGMTEMNAH